jgi:hypothetical protein
MPLLKTGIASPLFHALKLPLGRMIALARIENPWDQDVALKRELGVPSGVFTNAAGLLNLGKAGTCRIVNGTDQA